MKVGDIIRLKQPFCPDPRIYKAYRYAVVAELIQPATGLASAFPAEILVNLYDPVISEVYTDERGVKVLYVFYPEEIELA